MKYEEQRKLVEDLRTLADFFERPESVALPLPWSMRRDCHNVADGGTWDSAAKESTYDNEKSLANLRKVARALGTCEKVYPESADENFTVIKKFGHSIKLEYFVPGKVTCERKLVGVETVPARIVEAHTVKKYEYECKPIKLMA